MTTHQRTRRLMIWRDSFSALSIRTFLMLLSALADRITQ